MLAGNPFEWPKQFGGSTAFSTSTPHKLTSRRMLARSQSSTTEEEEDDGQSAIYARTNEHGVLVSGTGLAFSGTSERSAWFDDGTLYAAVVTHGKGFVLGIASDELITNAGLAHPGNAAVMVSIFSAADRLEMRLADAEDGVSPPTTPIAALLARGARDRARPRGRRGARPVLRRRRRASRARSPRRRRAAAPSPSTSRPWARSTRARATRRTR